jgi:hypothetical protein
MREVNIWSRRGGLSLAALVGLQLLSLVPLAAGSRPAALTIPSGTDIPVTIDENIALKQDQIGKTFSAHITRNVLVNGAVAIPAGTPMPATWSTYSQYMMAKSRTFASIWIPTPGQPHIQVLNPRLNLSRR